MISDRPAGADRVREHTPAHVNERIDREAVARLTEAAGLPAEDIGKRIAALEREWDIDRALMANFAILGGGFFANGLRSRAFLEKGNAWLYLFGVQLGFLLTHAVVGWCPPVPLFRRLGFRTQQEIQWERHALERALEQSRGRGEAAAPLH